jgi:hypothetical protein
MKFFKKIFKKKNKAIKEPKLNYGYNYYIETIPLEFVERIKEHEMFGDIMDIKYNPIGKYFNVYIKIR